MRPAFATCAVCMSALAALSGWLVEPVLYGLFSLGAIAGLAGVYLNAGKPETWTV